MPTGSWSSEEEQRLLRLIRETGMTRREIAQKLGRTEASVVGRLGAIRKRMAEEE
ncbi:DNA-binding NarL/FixJ family response regulator [Bradyrhizobium sp. USDA 4454]